MIPRTSRSERTAEPKRPGRLTALAVAALILAAVFAASAWRDSPLTLRAAAYAQDVATASAAVYVTLRTLNSFLSTAEAVEVNGGVFGVVGGAAHPLKFLEPIDDTVERIAAAVFGLMLVAGVLSVAMGPVGGIGWLMVAIAGLTWLIGWGAGRAARHTPDDGHRHGALGRQLLWYGAFFAVALPASFLIADSMADWLTADAWERNQAVIDDITGGIASADPTADDRGVLDKVDEYRKLAGSIYDRAGDLVHSYVALLSIFIFKLFVLTLLLAGGFLVAARTLARGGA